MLNRSTSGSSTARHLHTMAEPPPANPTAQQCLDVLMDLSTPFVSCVLSETMCYCFYSLSMKETSYMLAETNSTPDEHICSTCCIRACTHACVCSCAWSLVVTNAHPYYPIHTLQYVQYDHAMCNHTIIHHGHKTFKFSGFGVNCCFH